MNVKGRYMGNAEKFEQEKLVIGVLISIPGSLDKLRDILVREWGDIDLETAPVPFDYTDYYNAEMGTPIFRCFFSFERLIHPEELTAVKLQTNEIEAGFADDQGRRKINLDPGILSLSKFILATTKNNAHRIPMNRGIYGELTLQYKNRDFLPLEWTYPDFRSRENRDVLIKVRDIYKKQRKTAGI